MGMSAPQPGRAPPEPGRRYLIAEVLDTGVGIPEDARALIFQKFYRLRSKPGARVRGAGLGLHFCKHVAQAHGGAIWVAARPDGAPGSVFAFSLPVAGELRRGRLMAHPPGRR